MVQPFKYPKMINVDVFGSCLEGLMDEYALYLFWSHLKGKWAERAQRGKLLAFHCFVALTAICFGCFFTVYFFNPVQHHGADTVLGHTIPYLALQLGYFLFLSFVSFILPVGSIPTWQKVGSWPLVSVVLPLPLS